MRILGQIGGALDEIHARGFVHRDLKPANILLDEKGDAFLSDFGLVQLVEADETTRLTTARGVVGTPTYMSPEQATGEARIDKRSDIYSLGVILFEMLAGRPPYTASSPIGLAVKHANEPIPRILDVNPRLPASCQRVIERALAKLPVDRYASAREMVTALAEVTDQASKSQSSITRRIGHYEGRQEIGRGGMATVYRAYDPRIKRDVAIKVLPREFLHDPTFKARFGREARTIASLEHPAIVPVYDFGEEDGQPFLVMRLMHGGSLADRIKTGALPIADALAILSHIAPGLDGAHARGVVHRDLKPNNILFDQRGDAAIADFGIAKLIQAGTTLGRNMLMGTPAYMSPE
jgi:serine/threonine protein kinase